MRILLQLLVLLKDYCRNSSIANVGYIVNNRLHITERLFWLICFSLSAICSYYLIDQFQQDFENKAISIVYDLLPPSTKIYFPTLAICPRTDRNPPDVDRRLEEYVKYLQKDCDSDYSYNVEIYLFSLMYPDRYMSLISQCSSLKGCIKCPDEDYRLLLKFYLRCEEFFVKCAWYGEEMNCCDYFLPFVTSTGMCYMLNSIHNNKPGNAAWLHSEIDKSLGKDELLVETTKDLAVYILDEEDIPNPSMKKLTKVVRREGSLSQMIIYKEDMTNDVDIRELSPEKRKCRFPDEVLPNSIYEYYSFNNCILDCVRQRQLKICNCTLFLMVVRPDDKTPICDYEGNLCLEKHYVLRWNEHPKDCKCLLSCNEAATRIVSVERFKHSNTTRKLNIRVLEKPSTKYRRQAVRTQLDVVVTFGGILGLILGGSLLSGIELIYFFTIRICNNRRLDINNEAVGN